MGRVLLPAFVEGDDEIPSVQCRQQLTALCSDLNLRVVGALWVALELCALKRNIPLHLCSPFVCNKQSGVEHQTACAARTQGNVQRSSTSANETMLAAGGVGIIQVLCGIEVMDRPARSCVGPRKGFPTVRILIGTGSTSRGWKVLAPAAALNCLQAQYTNSAAGPCNTNDHNSRSTLSSACAVISILCNQRQ